jgi:hypothetical protein
MVFLFLAFLIVLILAAIYFICAFTIANKWVVSDAEYQRRINSKNIIKYDGCSGNLSEFYKFFTGKYPQYEHCCDIHDQAYFKGGTSEERRKADNELWDCVKRSGNPNLATLLYYVCRVGGHLIFPTSYRWDFGKNILIIKFSKSVKNAFSNSLIMITFLVETRNW